MPYGITGWEMVWPGNHALFPNLHRSGGQLSLPASLVPAAPKPLRDRDVGFALAHPVPKTQSPQALTTT